METQAAPRSGGGRRRRAAAWLAAMGREVRQGARALRKSPGFTAVAVATLALGIGANTAMFSVVNAVLLRPLPFKGSDRLVTIWASLPRRHRDQLPTSLLDYFDWRRQATAFTSLAAFTDLTLDLSRAGEPERLAGFEISADLFPTLGVAPALGRNFRPDEDRRGGPRVVILGHRLWRQRFAADPGILGQGVTLDGRRYTVVGVMPAGFEFPIQAEPGQLFIPLQQDEFALMWRRDGREVYTLARLRPGVAVARAQAEMETITRRLESQYPETNAGFRATVLPWREQLAGKSRRALLVLLGGVGFLLLIACANLANLFLTRSAARRRELAIRAALGAGRLRLVRQLLAETMLVAVSGGAAGVLLAAAGVRLAAGWLPVDIPRLGESGVDLGVLLFAAALSLATGLLFGLQPALRAARPVLADTLHDAARGSAGARQRSAQKLLVSAEVALALVLTTGAGLLLRSFSHLLAVEPGFRPARLLAVPIDLARERYPRREQQRVFVARLLERARQLPGASGAAVVFPLPLASRVAFPLEIVGRPPAPGERPGAFFRAVSPGYFATMGIPVVAGRDFSGRDRNGAAPVAVVNRTLARRYWPGRSPLGERLTITDVVHDHQRIVAEIVGVVGDVRHAGLDAPPGPEMYLPFDQCPFLWMHLVVHTAIPPSALAGAVAGQVRAIDPETPVGAVATLDEMLARSLAPRRFQSLLLGAFALLAVALTAVGIWGVASYSVAQRRREMGIRLALGARPGDLLWLVLSEGGRLGLAGAAVGVAGALGLTRLLRGLLFGVSPTDPVTFAAGVALVLALTLAASWLPARRAMDVDPVVALRQE
jgi:putative ABC transport system permease protein